MSDECSAGQAGNVRGGCRSVSGARLSVVVVGVTMTALAVSGCQASVGATQPSVTESSSTSGQTPAATATSGPVRVDVTVKNDAKNVAPSTPLKVTVTDGRIDSVTLTTERGAVVPGTQQDGTWVLGRTLAPDTGYLLTVMATGTDGGSTTVTRAFRTLKPRVEATYRVTPDGQTVGVGMPVSVVFDSAVTTPEHRAAVEKAIGLTITPAQTGSWGWSSNTHLYWRPRTFWKAGTKVVVKAPLAGLQTGDSKFIGEDKSATFTVGPARISKVDLKKHQMTVAENGKLVATYPISGGLNVPKYVTRSGVKVITEKHDTLTMDAATLGVKEDDPDYYKLTVNYAMRVTNTGEFLHSAPWSVWAQGRSNVSHGCVNMGPRDAKAMYESSKIGDVVIFVGSNRQFKPGEGLDVWTYDWPAWQARSARVAANPAAPGKTATTPAATPGADTTSATSTTATARAS